jgi:hypothetical protein
MARSTTRLPCSRPREIGPADHPSNEHAAAIPLLANAAAAGDRDRSAGKQGMEHLELIERRAFPIVNPRRRHRGHPADRPVRIRKRHAGAEVGCRAGPQREATLLDGRGKTNIGRRRRVIRQRRGEDELWRLSQRSTAERREEDESGGSNARERTHR